MIKENECYDKLNKLLDNVYFKFINNNLDLIANAINESIGNFGNTSFEVVEQLEKEVKKEDIIDVTRKFLKYIDSSERLFNFFDECFNNNKIYLWDSNEREFVLDKYIGDY